MTFNKMFSRVLAACFALSLFALTVAAQTDTRLREVTNITTTTTEPGGTTRLENDPLIISRAQPVLATASRYQCASRLALCVGRDRPACLRLLRLRVERLQRGRR